MTKIIGITQLKGGTGRSTLATNLVAQLARLGSTTLIDCDIPQGTSASWYALRSDRGKTDNIDLITIDNHQMLINKVQSLHCDFVIIDAPPRIAEITRAILMLSDVLLIPLGTSAAEIWATTDLLDTIREAQKQQPDLVYRIVWNRFRSYTRSAHELKTAVQAELNAPSLNTTIGHRVAYSDNLAIGLSVTECKDKAAKNEIQSLTAEVLSLLGEKNHGYNN